MDRKADYRLKYISSAVILALLSLLAAFTFSNVHYFEIAALDDGEVIYKARIQPGFRFSTTFRHSVQLSDWTDLF